MVHKDSKNSRNRRDKPEQFWRILNCIDEALKKFEKKKDIWHSNKEKYSQGKLKVYTRFKSAQVLETT